MELLQVKNLSYSIGHKSILKKVNFSLSLGNTYVLRGDNGAGKSTLLKLLVNFNHHKETILWKDLPPKRAPLSFLGHELGLYNSLSLEENLRFFWSLSAYSHPWERIEEWVDICNLRHRWEDPIYSFSRGMKQKAALIRAISVRPVLLLLDEPFTGLDDKSYPVVIQILRGIKSESAILGVVHGLEDDFWDHKLTIDKGLIQ